MSRHVVCHDYRGIPNMHTCIRTYRHTPSESAVVLALLLCSDDDDEYCCLLLLLLEEDLPLDRQGNNNKMRLTIRHLVKSTT